LRTQDELLLRFTVRRAGLEAGGTNRGKGQAKCGVSVTQGGGLGGLALGWYETAPVGAPEVASSRMWLGELGARSERGHCRGWRLVRPACACCSGFRRRPVFALVPLHTLFGSGISLFPDSAGNKGRFAQPTVRFPIFGINDNMLVVVWGLGVDLWARSYGAWMENTWCTYRVRIVYLWCTYRVLIMYVSCTSGGDLVLLWWGLGAERAGCSKRTCQAC